MFDSFQAMAAQRRSVRETVHRPWPLPPGRWIVAQSWLELAFVHWPVDPTSLRPLVPPELGLDTFQQQSWVGVVPFRMRTVRFAGAPPVLGTSAFPEVNVRTYVVRDGKPGVFFLSLDANNPVAIQLGRRMYGLPYLAARIEMKRRGSTVTFRSERLEPGAAPAAFAAAYGPQGQAEVAHPDTLLNFLTERYCFYTVGRTGIHRTDIHHLPWRLHPATVEPAHNSLLAPFGFRLLSEEPLVHYSAAQHVVAWRPVPID